MPTMTNERRMQQALQIIQTWAFVAAQNAGGTCIIQEFLDICKLAEKTLKECDEHDAKKKGRKVT